MSKVKTIAYIVCLYCTHLPSKYYLAGFGSYLLSIKLKLDKMTVRFGMSSVSDMSFKALGIMKLLRQPNFIIKVVANRSIVKGDYITI